MGLCKCPKRQITNQFCFEHRVNVCEFCIATSHLKCIVQSYLQWLKDSDYNSNCSLCGISLESEDCVRLICFHVFHWSCLNARQGSLPSNTTPDGHSCPACSNPIFPPANLVSPVADVLRSRLGQVNWGRNELGLPLLSDEIKEMRTPSTSLNHPNKSNGLVSGVFNENQSENKNNPHSVLHIDSSFNPSHNLHASSRRQIMINRSEPIGSDRDDENKYKRRTPIEMFLRWTRRLYSPSSRPPWRRTWFIVLSGILIFILIIYLMAIFGRRAADNDPMLIQNPIHHIED